MQRLERTGFPWCHLFSSSNLRNFYTLRGYVFAYGYGGLPEYHLRNTHLTGPNFTMFYDEAFTIPRSLSRENNVTTSRITDVISVNVLSRV